MDIRELLDERTSAASAAMVAFVRQKLKESTGEQRDNIVKIMREKIGDEMLYEVSVEGAMEEEVFTEEEFFSLLYNIKIVDSHPIAVVKTQMLELCYRSGIKRSAYIVSHNGWAPRTTILTLRDLRNIYKTAQLLVKYRNPYCPKDE